MATDSWRSGNGSGNWSDGNDWFTFSPPGTADTALLAGTGPYVVTVDSAKAVANVILGSPGVTLAIAATLTVASSVAVGTSAEVDLAGLFGGGTIDLTGGGVLEGDGGTLDGFLLLGPASTIDGTGTLTNQGVVEWTTTGAAAGAIGIATPDFVNLGLIALSAVTQSFTEEVVTSVTPGKVKPTPSFSALAYTQEIGAVVSISSGNFTNEGTLAIGAGTLDLTGGTFDNIAGAVVSLIGGTTESIQATGTSDGITTYGVVTNDVTTQVTVGVGVSFQNSGTLLAGSVVFEQPMALGQLGGIAGALTFEAGLDLAGGTLSAGTVQVAGLVQDGSIGGTGTLILQSGATLDNVSIGAGVTVQTLGTGPVKVVDPPSTTQPITLDAVLNEVDFATVSTFDGSIVLGAGASNDVIGVLTPGGVTLGAGFNLTDSVASSLLTFGGTAGLLNDGTFTVSGASVEIATTLDGVGSFMLNDDALVQISALGTDAVPSVAFGTGTSTVLLPGTGSIGAVLSGLQAGDEIDFVSVSSSPNAEGLFGNGAAAAAGGTLDLTGASGDTASVPLGSSAGGLTFNVNPDPDGGSLVTVACFASGTRLAVARGEAAVETLRPGDMVRTAGGRLAPVRWVGWTRIDLLRHPMPWKAAPVCVRAGAFAPGQPGRDLLLSPEHCVLVGGALVPVCLLLNGATIARSDGLAAVTYWHVELDRHDVVLAEGLAAESYLDTGNRALFAGEVGARALHADFSGPPDAAALRVWAEHGCEVLRLTAPDAREALAARAEALGWTCGEDSGADILANGAPVPCVVTEAGLSARLPAGTTRVRVLSRSFVPAEQDVGSADPRRLGLAVARVCVAGWPLHPDALRAGWSLAAGEAWRWTDGDAEIAVPRLARPSLLELRLHRLGRYWRPPVASEVIRLADRRFSASG